MYLMPPSAFQSAAAELTFVGDSGFQFYKPAGKNRQISLVGEITEAGFQHKQVFQQPGGSLETFIAMLGSYTKRNEVGVLLRRLSAAGIEVEYMKVFGRKHELQVHWNFNELVKGKKVIVPSDFTMKLQSFADLCRLWTRHTVFVTPSAALWDVDARFAYIAQAACTALTAAGVNVVFAIRHYEAMQEAYKPGEWRFPQTPQTSGLWVA